MTAAEVVRLLGLAPHPEGGFYAETFRAPAPAGERGASTAIYYLLPAGEVSAWHRVVDADEVWHYYAGAPLELTLAAGGERSVVLLGSDLAAGQRPQGVVPAGVWQTARTLGGWTLVGCTVAPGFRFESFEMAPGGDPG
ncbi:MAG TPA: cupin domain-containing protein [Thermoanaerobaculia bacterium]|nr:cupin domain-containing protein [Thermoanaerobaculia bacterium]